MQIKDYYRILQIEPTASQLEIKKAYRKLAHQYHPDKNTENQYASAHFTEIKEAYEVLTNPSKKEYYLQQRWYNKSIGKRKTQEVITPVNVLKQVLELEKYVSQLDAHRMDKQGLADYLSDILTGTVISQLLPFKEQNVNNQIIITALIAMAPLTSRQAEILTTQIIILSEDNVETKKTITEFLARKNQKEKKEKYQPFILAIIVLAICFFIWLMGR
jgi:hypothetical protein